MMSSWWSQLRILPALRRHPRATRDEILAFQNQQLRKLVAHAYQNVVYYRRLFDRVGVKPQDIRSVADLSILPVTSKQDLQGLPAEEVLARGVDPERLIVHRTGGSSGEPFIVRRTWIEERLLNTLRRRALHYWGMRMRDKRVSIWLTREPHPRDNRVLDRITQAAGLYRWAQVSCLLPPEDIVRALQRLQPNVVSGYAAVLARISEVVGEADGRPIRPRFIISGSEVLTPRMRWQISEAFAAPLFEVYNCHEFHYIGWECKKSGEYHVCDDGVILEVLENGRQVETGERGEVIGTALHSFAMPLIRYRLGDIVTKGVQSCPCGEPFSTIRAVQGRMLDYFALPGGRVMHPYEVLIVLRAKAFMWIRRYQVVQERENRVVLRAVPSVPPSPEQIATVHESLAALLGPGVDLRIDLVSDLEPDVSGKFRIYRSLVKSAYDNIDWNA
jgi:phenylacetate-CoA ligase